MYTLYDYNTFLKLKGKSLNNEMALRVKATHYDVHDRMLALRNSDPTADAQAFDQTLSASRGGSDVTSRLS